MDRPPGTQPRRCLTVVNYHHVRAAPDPEFPRLHGLTLAQFRAQLDALAREFDMVAPEDLEAALTAGEPMPERACLLTFDDGLRDHYETVFPELRERGLRALFFICTAPLTERILLTVHRAHLLSGRFGYLELREELLAAARAAGAPPPGRESAERAPLQYRYDDRETAEVKYYLNFQLRPEQRERTLRTVFRSRLGADPEYVTRHYMSPAEVCRLRRAGMTVGLHSHGHLPLAAVPEAEMREDLRQNREHLVRLLGESPRWISYPYGGPDAWSPAVMGAARELGCVGGFTMKREVNRLPVDPLAISRLDTNDAPGGKSPLALEGLECASA